MTTTTGGRDHDDGTHGSPGDGTDGPPVTVDVHDDPGRSRYVITEDGGEVGFVTYRMAGGVLDLVHTEVDPDHGGRGLAARLIGRTLDDARRRGLAVLPHYPYVRRYIDEHPDPYLDLVPAARRAEFGWTDGPSSRPPGGTSAGEPQGRSGGAGGSAP